MTSLFDDINQFDEGFLAARREAVAVAQKRVQDRVGSYLKVAKTAEEYDARLSYVSDDVRQIVADVAEEFSIDHDKLADAIDEHLKGDGITDIDAELADAPSAVGQKAAGGHKPGCTCGFCKNKGNLPGRVDQKEQEDKDASEPHDDDDSSVVDKESSVRLADDEPVECDKCEGLGTEKDGSLCGKCGGSGELDPETAKIHEERNASVHEAEGFRTDPATCPNCHNGMTLTTSREAQQGGAPLEYACSKCGYHGESEEHRPGRMQFQEGLTNLISPQSSTRQADAPRDGGGATKTVSLPTGKGDAVGYGASPKIDKKEWKPNALNADGNLPPVDSEMSGSPNPTETQDLVDEKPDYDGDFLRDTDAVTTQQDLPSADDTGQSTERNLSQEGQGGTWTEEQTSPVTSEVFASVDPDINPLKAILDSGFTPDNQVESAIREFESE